MRMIWPSGIPIGGGVTETRRDETRPNSATLKQIFDVDLFPETGTRLLELGSPERLCMQRHDLVISVLKASVLVATKYFIAATTVCIVRHCQFEKQQPNMTQLDYYYIGFDV